MRGTGHPCGVPPRPTGAAPLPAYRGPQRGPQCAPLRPTACAASPCVSPLRPPSGGNESPSVVRGVGHTGLRPFFPSPLPGAWPLRFSVKGSRFAPKSSPVRCSGLRPCAPLRLPVSPLTLPLRSTAGQPDSQTAANRPKRPVAAFFGLGGTSGRGGARKRAVGPFPGFLAVSAAGGSRARSGPGWLARPAAQRGHGPDGANP